MYILSIRTDKEEAEVGLFKHDKQLGYISWQAHKHLSETINLKINELLKKSNLNLSNIKGIIIYKGPGSFTGLRIGFSLANTLAYSLNVPLLSISGKGWIQDGIKQILNKENDFIALPNYGRAPHTTKPKK